MTAARQLHQQREYLKIYLQVQNNKTEPHRAGRFFRSHWLEICSTLINSLSVHDGHKDLGLQQFFRRQG
jgi:hypothetical protein